jgi:cytochrome c-type protein NapB
MIKQSIITIATIGLFSMTATAANTTACAGCHGANFEKAALGKSKIVKDMSQADIETALNGYKDGSYGGAMKGIMVGQVAKLSKEDITEIAKSIGGATEAPTADANKTETPKADANKTVAPAAK